MKRLEVSGAVRPLEGSLGVEGLIAVSCTWGVRFPDLFLDYLLDERFACHFLCYKKKQIFFWNILI